MRDPTEIWNILRATFLTVSEASIDTYLAKYQRMRMKPFEKVLEFVNRLTLVENQLYDVGHILKEGDKKRALLRGLRDEFKVTAEVVRITGKGLSEAISQLVMAELSISESADDEDNERDQSKALSTVGNSNTDATREECSHCGRSGHIKDDCFRNPSSKSYRNGGLRFKQENKPGKRQGKQNKNHAGKGKGSSAYTTFLARSTENKESNNLYSSKCVIDSGASAHMCNSKEAFHALDDVRTKDIVLVGNGQRLNVEGRGILRCEAVVHGGSTRNIQLKNVLYVPKLMCNLLSVSQSRKAGLRIIFDSDKYQDGVCEFQSKDGDVILTCTEQVSTGLYETILNTKEVRGLSVVGSKVNLWHQRLGHAGKTILQGTIPLVRGLNIDSVNGITPCDQCARGKATRASRKHVPKGKEVSTRPLDLVHTDIVGPMHDKSFGGALYFIPVYDDASSLSLVRFIRSKDDAPKAVQEMVTELETALNGKVKRISVKRLRSDNDSVFLSSSFQEWLKEKGIIHERTAAYSPESNGKAERLNRTLMDMARTMLTNITNADMRSKLWAEAINTSNFIRNRIYCTAASEKGKTPYEIIMRKKPDIGFIRTFGSKCFVHIPKQKQRKKFEGRAKVGILVGYDRGNCYRVFIPHEKRTVVARDVRIHEDQQFRTKNESSGDVQCFPDHEYKTEEH